MGATLYSKWHISRFRGDPQRGKILMVSAFLSFSSTRGQTATPILKSDISKRVFLRELHSFGGQNKTEQRYPISQFQGTKSPTPPKIGPVSSQNVKHLQQQYLQKSKSNKSLNLKLNQEVKIKTYKIGSQGRVARVT